MSKPEEAFWIVWCPTGRDPPKKRHPGYAEAHAEAQRLANSAPGATFYVLKAASVVRHCTTVTTELVNPDEIPF